MSYLSAILADSPDAAWLLQDLTGTTAVEAVGGGAPNGTYIGSPALGVSGPGADLPYGVAFDGLTQEVTIANHALLGLGAAFTIEWWIAANCAAQEAYGYVISKGTSGDDHLIPYVVRYFGDGRSVAGAIHGSATIGDRNTLPFTSLDAPVDPDALVSSGSSAYEVDPIANLLGDGEWHLCHMIGEGVGGKIRMLVDGVVAQQINQTKGIYTNTEMLRLARGYTYFRGRLAGVALYTHALTATRVDAHLAAVGTPSCIDLCGLGHCRKPGQVRIRRAAQSPAHIRRHPLPGESAIIRSSR